MADKIIKNDKEKVEQPKKEEVIDKKEVLEEVRGKVKKEIDKKDKLIADLKAKLDEEKKRNQELVVQTDSVVRIPKFKSGMYIPKANITEGKVSHRDKPKIPKSNKIVSKRRK